MAEAGVDIMSMVAEDSGIRQPLEQIAKREQQKRLAERNNDLRAAEKLEIDIENLKATAQENAQTKVNDVSNALSGSDDLIGFINQILEAWWKARRYRLCNARSFWIFCWGIANRSASKC
jgi:hypothetical protein